MPVPVLLTKEEIHQRFDMSLYDPINNLDHDRVIFVDGDLTIQGNLSSDWAVAVLEELKEDTYLGSVLIMINGNLTVEGDINIGDYHPILLVLGNVHCDVLKSGDDTIHITGDAHIKYAFYGCYNDGTINIDGTTYVPYVLNSDHSSNIKPEGAILINTYGDSNDFFEYDYTREVLPQTFIRAVFDDKDEFDEYKFIDWVKSGQSPFNEGAKPTRVLYEEELERLTSGNIEEVLELDWSDRKWKVFPPSIAKLKYLKKLTLSKNYISEIPAAIGELENLEELYMNSSGVKTIDEAIGNLKKLRVLDLGANHHLGALPDAIGELSELQILKIDYISAPLPESLTRLEKLEAITMYSCYRETDHSASFPEVITRLKNLKRLDFRENKIKEMPDSILNIQTLEEFQWTGGSTSSSNFPDFTQFKHLKKLVISRKFNSWKDRIFNITTLEHLAIDRNAEDKKYINQQTLDSWIEMAADMDDAFKQQVQWIQENKQLEPDGRLFYIATPGMQAEELQDIYLLEHLKYLDLSFNNLTWLPDTFYELQHLEYLNLQYNKFPEHVKERITQAFPDAEVIFMSDMEMRVRGLTKK